MKNSYNSLKYFLVVWWLSLISIQCSKNTIKPALIENLNDKKNDDNKVPDDMIDIRYDLITDEKLLQEEHKTIIKKLEENDNFEWEPIGNKERWYIRSKKYGLLGVEKIHTWSNRIEYNIYIHSWKMDEKVRDVQILNEMYKHASWYIMESTLLTKYNDVIWTIHILRSST